MKQPLPLLHAPPAPPTRPRMARRRTFRAVDEDIVAFAVLGVQNWMVTWYRPDGRLSPEQIADQFADLFLSGLRKEMSAKPI